MTLRVSTVILGESTRYSRRINGDSQRIKLTCRRSDFAFCCIGIHKNRGGISLFVSNTDTGDTDARNRSP
ncbi:MAG: hypothetical protein LBH04_10330 [Tannerellaceae bacterium]|nr:hypothetical protein [Tannerellaceae bacterium]